MKNVIEWKTLIYQSVKYDNYEINNNGDVRHKKYMKILKRYDEIPTESHKASYVYCNICIGKRSEKNKKTKKIILHRAVAETFIKNENSYSFVLFKDGDLKNVQANNLYWSKTKSSTMSDEERKARRRKNNGKYVSARRKKIKEMSVEYKGGKCIVCGYNKCKEALEFHHLDPTKKDFGIAYKGITKSWEKVKIELDKCICVCANCHREIHNNYIDISNLKIA